MSLKTHVAAIVATLDGSPTFVYGTKKELNTLADNVDFDNDKAAVFMFSVQDEQGVRSNSGGRKATFGIYMQFLRLSEYEEFTDQTEPLVDEMRQLKDSFLNKLGTYEVNGSKVFNIQVGEKDRSRPVYKEYDNNCVGVSLSLELREMYKNSFC